MMDTQKPNHVQSKRCASIFAGAFARKDVFLSERIQVHHGGAQPARELASRSSCRDLVASDSAAQVLSQDLTHRFST